MNINNNADKMPCVHTREEIVHGDLYNIFLHITQ